MLASPEPPAKTNELVTNSISTAARSAEHSAAHSVGQMKLEVLSEKSNFKMKRSENKHCVGLQKLVLTRL